MIFRNFSNNTTIPDNIDFQSLTPIFYHRNDGYNFTGGFCKNPINSKIASIWDKGHSHYVNNDLHSVVGQVSLDNGNTYGNEFIVAEGAGVTSYTNASMGYSNNGRLHCLYSKIEHTVSGQNSLGLFCKYSDNDGTNWSSEISVSGLGVFDFYYGNSKIIESNDGNLYTPVYEYTISGDVNVKLLHSTNNGISWSVKSVIKNSISLNELLSETSISKIDDNTLLCVSRVQSRNYYTQFLSIDNGTTWTEQGNTNLGDWWTDETTGVSSLNVHLNRTDTFIIDGVKCVAIIYLNRGVNASLSLPSYLRVCFAKSQDIINNGVNGWVSSDGLEITLNNVELTKYDGYPDVQFFNNDVRMSIRNFKDYSGDDRTDTEVQYLLYNLNKQWLRSILNI